MTKGILGRKIGMTSIFTEDGLLVAVTVVQVQPNVVLQKKTIKTDGYEALQIGLEDLREGLANKPKIGHAAKAQTAPKRFVREIRGLDLMNYEVGQEIKADLFEAGEIVDVTGTSKGKGFAGAIKRFNYSIGPKGHGSGFHRSPGSLGTTDPGRVFKGKGMPGHMGHETVTIQNLEVVKVDLERNVILIKGNVPGPKKSLVVIKNATKVSK
jgi:large subunit ribosomal protein L3